MIGSYSFDAAGAEGDCVHIGLVNNMPSAAVEATERQFRTLLADASAGIAVQLSLFALPEIPRSDDDKRRAGGSYSDISALWNAHLDGIIVTGAEPITQKLEDEPYWESLGRLVEWADGNVFSSIWSCLAAHAAVLKLDGIKRKAFEKKRFGIFECVRGADTPLAAGLMDGIPARQWMPHSRWNTLPSDALAERGYEALTRCAFGGVDTFAKLKDSLFLCFQGHPEYLADTLLLEYRRDVGRFLQGERKAYPTTPFGYFDADAIRLTDQFRDCALSLSGDERKGLLGRFPTLALAGGLKNSWRPAAVALYRNWLKYLVEQKKSSGRVTALKAQPEDRATYYTATG